MNAPLSTWALAFSLLVPWFACAAQTIPDCDAQTPMLGPPPSTDGFGASVAIDGDLMIVGAPRDDTVALNSGAVYVFDAATGAQLRKITPSDLGSNDNFGQTVALCGTTAVIGAPSQDALAVDSGAAYLINISTGEQLAKLDPLNLDVNSLYGSAVAIDGGTAIVGAFADDSMAINSGSAFVFDSSTGALIRRLTDVSAGGFHLGRSVAIEGDMALVGAHRLAVQTGFQGGAILFDTITGSIMARFIINPDGTQVSNIGESIALENGIVAIGTHEFLADGSRGSIYVFERTTGDLLHKLVSPLPGFGFGFGQWISIDEGRLMAADRSNGIVIGYNALSGDEFVRLIRTGTGQAVDVSIRGNRVGIGWSGGPESQASIFELHSCIQTPCSGADLADPLGILDFNDIVALLDAFGAMDPAADFAEPYGVFNFNDIIAYLNAFSAGCP